MASALEPIVESRRHDLRDRTAGLALLTLVTLTSPATATEPALDSWTSLDPPGGSIHEIAVAPSDPTIRYAVGATVARIYRWDASTERWESRGVIPDVVQPTLAIDPVDPSTVWAGGTRPTSSELWVGRSTDGGATWSDTHFESSEETDFVVDFSVAPGRTLLSAAYSGVWLRESDGWTRVLPGLDAGGVEADPDDLDSVFATVGSELWHSEDGGLTWSSVLPPDSYVYDVFVAGGGSSAVYAAFVDLALPHAEGVYRSLDNGTVWRRFEGNAPSALSPDEPSTLWAAEWDHVERSTDGGRSWSPVPLDLGIGHPRLVGVVFGAAGEVSVFGSHGVWSSLDDATTWSDANQGLHEHTVASVTYDPVDSAGLWAMTVDAGFFHSTDGGVTWRRLTTLAPALASLSPRLTVVATEPRTLLLDTFGGGGAWLRSLDGGLTFDTVAPSADNALIDLPFDISSHPSEPHRLVAAGAAFDRGAPTFARLWSTDDAGRTWTQIESRSAPTAFWNVRHDPFEPDILYVSGRNFGIWRDGTYFDRLGHFDAHGNATHVVQAIAVDPAVPGRVWLVAGPRDVGSPIDPIGLLRSDDRGVTWTVVSDELLGRFVSDLEVVPGDSQSLLAVVDETVWSSDDAGSTWSVLAPRATRARDISIDPRFPSTLWTGSRVLLDPDDAFDDQAIERGVQRFVRSTGSHGTSSVLTLGDGFLAEVAWRDFEGATGIGTARALAQDTGAFWFFDAGNLEVMLKVLDGREINGAHWVFYGSLSNVAYTLRVTAPDGRVKAYTNPLGTFASTGDTGAFPVLDAP